MNKTIINAKSRTVFGKKLTSLRGSGEIPAIVYGQKQDNQPVSLKAADFSRTYGQVGQNTIVELVVDDSKPDNVLIHDVVHDPVTGDLTHVDFYRVNMNEKIRTHIPLHFMGDAPAVYQSEGTLLTNIEEVEVSTLPGQLPANIEVDISGLDDFEKSVHVRDLIIPEGVEVLVDADELVCKVEEPRSQEEIDALDEDIVEDIPAEEGEEVAEGEEAKDGEAEPKAEGEQDAKDADKKE